METIHYLFGDNLQSAIFIILNLILIEGLLSADNAAVLATMARTLPKDQQKKALRYGIFGAYFFRGLCLIFASILIKISWLKALGGLYLCWLCGNYFFSKANHDSELPQENLVETNFLKKLLAPLGQFWSTVIMIELIDLVFSIDNVFAAVAYSNKIGLICTGVFLGIVTMRLVAGTFMDLMEKFPFLETCAYVVIGILGLKLILHFACELTWLPAAIKDFCHLSTSHSADTILSVITLAIFIVPLLWKLLKEVLKKD
ncbi:MAG: hypothetical protein SFU25_07300 [Candidatus Caenarcaniphilales bacterium]|nr:hypothetical protein [Candidatus Caenarcaniphilales bacterium]